MLRGRTHGMSVRIRGLVRGPVAGHSVGGSSLETLRTSASHDSVSYQKHSKFFKVATIHLYLAPTLMSHDYFLPQTPSVLVKQS